MPDRADILVPIALIGTRQNRNDNRQRDRSYASTHDLLEAGCLYGLHQLALEKEEKQHGRHRHDH